MRVSPAPGAPAPYSESVFTPRLRSLLTLTAAAVILTGCTPDLERTAMPTSRPTDTPVTTPTVTPTATPTPTPSAPSGEAAPVPAELTCDTMLDPTVDAELRARGLAPAPKYEVPFLGTVSGAHASCPWSSPGKLEPEVMYSYTALTPAERAEFVAAATASNYVAEETPDGLSLVWVAPDGSSSPNEGSWIVADEWVALAPSRDAISDILLTR